MPLFQSRLHRSARPPRRANPSCRGGASSLLRLAQPAATRRGGFENSMSTWLARAAGVLAPVGAPVLTVRPSEFAPSQWLVGH